MQIIVKRMTLVDLILNIFYRIRFNFYRDICKNKLKNSSPIDKEGWELTFSDEFDTKTWSPSGTNTKWKIGEGWGAFHPDKPNVYYGPPEIVPNTSTAKFTVKYNPKTFPDDFRTGNPITIPFQVSLISSQKSFKQQYGRFECRMTLPLDKAAWPAFWTWGTTWPPEIDILESTGGMDGKTVGRNAINLHYGFTQDGTKSSSGGWRYWVQKKPGKIFHEFVCIWGPKKIEVFTNGIKVFRITNKKTLEWFNAETAEQWIIVNHSLQNNFTTEDAQPPAPWPDHVLPKDYTSEFLVDYVRVYKNKE